ncbi:TetR/AcrR family transcriptional regulator [Virgibacillus sp. W0430]|uniref:TetR/AcrR family transcriptional regulator n=1 Tax=Virgibacillus sp. W0430 TaxID=3391580 RepID=UPI003F4881A3
MNGFQRRSEMKKNNIVQAALRLFTKSGVQSVSVAKIASEANVSQVTIYNYFTTKENLVQEVIESYIDQEWKAYEQLLNSDLPFPDKIKQIIFEKKEATAHMHENFYHYFMEEYSEKGSYVDMFYKEKAIPGFITLFDEGKKEGYIDPTISNESILFYVGMLKDYMQQKEVNEKVLPLTEEITKLFFYGIVGKEKGELRTVDKVMKDDLE